MYEKYVRRVERMSYFFLFFLLKKKNLVGQRMIPLNAIRKEQRWEREFGSDIM